MCFVLPLDLILILLNALIFRLTSLTTTGIFVVITFAFFF